MKSLFTYIFKIIVLAVAYIALGKLSLMLAIPPGFASPVWPSAGLALAALLLWGYKIFPGVFIGAFLINYYMSYSAGVPLFAPASWITGSGAALGATLQACAGALLIRRYLRSSTRLEKEREIMMFLLLGGPLACLINAVIGPVSLFIAGFIDGSALPLTAFIWWVGDTTGVILFAPFVFLLGLRHVTLARKMIVMVPLLVLCAVVMIIFSYVRGAQLQSNQLQLKNVSTIYAEAIKQHVGASQDILKSIRRFYNSSDLVTRDDFDNFTRDIAQERRGIQALEWVPKVDQSERQKYEDMAREDGFSDFYFKERSDDNLVKAQEREFYYPVFYIEPYKGNEMALGYDLGSHSERLETLLQAQQTGMQSATDQITLVQAGYEEPGFLLFEPVYETGSVLNTRVQREEALLGFAVGVFKIEALIQTAIENVRDPRLNLYIYDHNKILGEDAPLYGARDADAPLSVERSLKMAGQDWRLVFTPKPDFVVDNLNWGIWLLLIGGLLFCGIFGAFLLVVSAQTERNIRAYRETLTSREQEEKSILVIPVLSGLLTLGITLALFVQVSQQQESLVQSLVKEEAALIKQAVQENVSSSLVAVRRMAQRWEASKGTPKAQWEQDAANYVSDNGALTTVEWIDSEYHIQWVEPLSGNENAVGLNVAFNPERKRILDQARQPGEITITPPLDLVQGYRAFIAYVPIYIEGEFEGFIAGIYDINTFLNYVVPEEIEGLFHITIYDDESLVYQKRPESPPIADRPYRTERVPLWNRDWVLMVTPSREFIQEHRTALPYITLAGGALLSLLVGLAIYYAAAARQRTMSLREQTQALLESEEQFRTAMEYSAIGMALVAPNGQWLKVNRALCSLTGYSEDELLEIDFQTITHPEDLDSDLEQVNRVLAGEINSYQMEKRYIHKEGHIVWILLNVTLTWHSDGRPKYFISQIEDITERKASEDKLNEAIGFQHLIMDSIPDLIFVKDDQFRIVEANSAFLSLYPKEIRGDIIGTTTVESYDPDEAKEFLKHDRIALDEGYSEIEETIRFPNGGMHVLLTKKVRFENAKGERFILGIARDITERKKSEKAIRDLNERMQLILDNAGEGIFGLDTDGYTIFANRAAQDILGYALSDMVNVSQHHLIHHSYPDGTPYPEDECLIYKALEDGKTYQSDQDVFWHKDGQAIPVEYVSTPIRDVEGVITGAVVVFRDITERFALEKEREKYMRDLELAKEEAQQANIMKSEFLANMSHEIRTPLNGIIGAADLLKKTSISKDQDKYLKVIMGSGETLLSLINDILDISKIEAGELEIHPEPVVIRDLIKDVIQSISLKANQKNIELAVNYEGNVPLEIMADSVRLAQIMVNLLGNAVKFVEEGHIAVTVREQKTVNDTVTLRISVEDTGIGIPHDKLESVFDKFAQADATTTKQYGGTGLGLAITQKLVDMMRGVIGVESAVGEGTTFWFDMPFKIVEPNRHSENKERYKALENLRVLVVDDMEISRTFISSALRRSGVNHDCVSSAQECMSALQGALDNEVPYDVVLMDYRMPGGQDGVNAAQEIKANPEFDDVKILLITALGKIQDATDPIDDLIQEGVLAGCILKPINAHDLRQKLFEVCVTQSGEESGDIRSEGAGKEEGANSGLNAHILLVENELVNQMVATDMLEDMGCTVDLAENGQEAVDMLSVNRDLYDVILMDCMMPVMDGFEATQAIRSDERENGHTPSVIIAMTANAMAGEKEKCLAVGMNDYLSKPVKEADLRNKIKGYLEH